MSWKDVYHYSADELYAAQVLVLHSANREVCEIFVIGKQIFMTFEDTVHFVPHCITMEISGHLEIFTKYMLKYTIFRSNNMQQCLIWVSENAWGIQIPQFIKLSLKSLVSVDFSPLPH